MAPPTLNKATNNLEIYQKIEPDKVNVRRAKIGLGTLADYKKATRGRLEAIFTATTLTMPV